MSIFNTTQMLDAMAPFFIRGRLIHVDLAAGNDNDDGSASNPYLTPSRGIQDLRTDQNDVLVIENNGASSVTAPISVSKMDFNQLRNFLVIGIGQPYFGPPTGANNITAIDSWSRIDADIVQITTTPNHNLAAGDVVLVAKADETGDSMVNGYWRAHTSIGPGTTQLIRVLGMTAPGNGAGQPYSGGATGEYAVCNTEFLQCENYWVAGVNYAGGLLGWTGVFQDGTLGANQSVGRNGKWYGCAFSNASLGFARLGGTGIGLDVSLSGTNFRIEKCVFNYSHFGTVREFPGVAYSALNDLVVSECIVFAADVSGTPSWARPFRRYGTDNQKYGVLFTANLIDNTFIPLATVYGTSRSALDAEPTNNVLHRNYYTGVAIGGTRVQVSSGNDGFPFYFPHYDTAAASYINQDNVPSHIDLMWDRLVSNYPQPYEPYFPFMGDLMEENLDAAVGDAATSAELAATQAAIQADIAALNDISIADVQTALTNQGYTTVRAVLLDNLDAQISTRAQPGDQMALTAAAIAAVADAVLAEPVGDHDGVADSLAAVIRRISHHTVGRAKFNTSNSAQWTLEVYEDDDRTNIKETFNLKKLNGTSINDANPLIDPVIADVDPV